MRLVLALCWTTLLLTGLSAAQELPDDSAAERIRAFRNRRMAAQPASPAVSNPVPESTQETVPEVQPQVPQAPPAAASVIGPPAPEPANLPPPTPPQVIYRDGLLTVRALNSTLGGVLAAIRSKTGIQFEGMEAAPERIAVSVGPAPEGEVLAVILSGSRFDYVAIDRMDSPGIVQRVILTPHTGAGSPAALSGSLPAPTAQGDEEAAEEADSDLQTPQDTAVRTPLMETHPIPPQPNPQAQGDPATKTPEQLLEELKQLQQRQQQRQQPTPQKVPQ